MNKLERFGKKCLVIGLGFFCFGGILLVIFNDAFPMLVAWMTGALFYGAYGAIETIREKVRKGEWKIEEIC